MHWRELELCEVIKAGGRVKTADIISRSRMCKVTALKYLKALKAAGHIDFEQIGPTKLWYINENNGAPRGVGSLTTSYLDIFRVLREYEETTGKKAFVLMSADDIHTNQVGMKVSLLEDGSPIFEEMVGVKG